MTEKIKIFSIEEIQALRRAIKNINIKRKEEFSAIDRLALFITERVGSMGFFVIIFLWTVGWLGWNIWGPDDMRFDPYPAFVLWLFISNMIQMLLMPLLMVGQNLLNKHAEARADADFEINKIAEKEIGTIIGMLEEQNKRLDEILRK